MEGFLKGQSDNLPRVDSLMVAQYFMKNQDCRNSWNKDEKVYLCSNILLRVAWSSSMRFPSDFKFGAATSSYQIEGGWDADGKGPSVWDAAMHSSSADNYYNNETGDVAADSYHQWPQDVKAAASMGLDFYRFSISWPRILPTGWINEINPAGVKYYSDLIDSLLAVGVQPIITLYHFDLPAAIQDLGGWANPFIVQWFGDYARLVFSLYADRVKIWLTINEGAVVCDVMYNFGFLAPRIREPVYGPFLCNKHVLMAHATAYWIFHEEFRDTYGGKVSLANIIVWMEPATSEDEELAELGRQNMIGRYAHPIFSKEGGWPPAIEQLMKEVSLRQGFDRSRLPAFTEDEKHFVRGTADFFSCNHYTTSMIRPVKLGETPGSWFLYGSLELNAILEAPPNSPYGALKYMPIYPKGIRRLLNWLRKEYGDIEILISENGLSTNDMGLEDYDRIDYLSKYMEQVLLAINIDGVRVTGYTVWTLIDNFEGFGGYKTRFGLYQTNYEDQNKTRTPRLSAKYYACVIEYHSLQFPSSCMTAYMTYLKTHRKQNGGIQYGRSN